MAADRVSTTTTPRSRDVVRRVLRLGIAAGAAVVGARSVGSAVARAWVGSKVIDNGADALTRSVR